MMINNNTAATNVMEKNKKVETIAIVSGMLYIYFDNVGIRMRADRWSGRAGHKRTRWIRGQRVSKIMSDPSRTNGNADKRVSY